MNKIYLKEFYNEGKEKLILKLIDATKSIKLNDDFYKNIYFQPYLISAIYGYLNQREIQNILSVYLENNERLIFKFSSDNTGRIFVPNYGYIHTEIKSSEIKFKFINKIFIPIENIDYKTELDLTIGGTKIVLEQYLNNYTNSFLKSQVSIGKIHSQKFEILNNFKIYTTIENALSIIKSTDITQFEEITNTICKICVFNHYNMTGFTSIEANGISFMFPRNCDNEYFFIDHLIHNSSHYVLDIVLIDTNSFFTIDPFELKFDSPLKEQKRGLYHCIHAVYVLTKIAHFFLKLINIEKECNYESIGRFLISIERAEIGLKNIAGSYYTERGLELINRISALIYHLNENSIQYKSKYSIKTQGKEFDRVKFRTENNLNCNGE